MNGSSKTFASTVFMSYLTPSQVQDACNSVDTKVIGYYPIIKDGYYCNLYVVTKRLENADG